MFRSLLELLSTAEDLIVPYLDQSMYSCNGHRESLETFAPPCIGPRTAGFSLSGGNR